MPVNRIARYVEAARSQADVSIEITQGFPDCQALFFFRREARAMHTRHKLVSVLTG